MAEVTSPRALTEDDERGDFDCGRESLNAWFRRHAWHNQAGNISRTSLICEAETNRIVGYVSLSSGQIEREFLAKADRRNRPDPIPVTLLGQLAVARAYQGQGYAHPLLRFALTAALRASREVGSFGVLTHPLDDTLRAFYGRWGFDDVPFDPRRAMIVRMVDLEKSGIAGS
jgi:predicted N-acetyltransferase YhbS